MSEPTGLFEWGTLMPGGGICEWGSEDKARKAFEISKTFPDGAHPVVRREVGGWCAPDSPPVEATPTTAEMVTEFHRSFGLPIGTGLDGGPSDDLRLRLLAEEFREYADAVAGGDLVEVVDALADMVYVIYGTAVVLGIDLDAALAEVHRSNMSKLQDGKPLLRADGKVLKGTDFTRPDIPAVLTRTTR